MLRLSLPGPSACPGPILRLLGHGACGLTVLSALALAAPAQADTLPAALSTAYMSNPTLRAERARQRATAEQVPQALSGWRPTVVANADIAKEWSDSNVQSPTDSEPGGISILLNQPVFDGLKAFYGTKAAKAVVLSGRQNLLAVEQDVLLAAVVAYMDVIRNRQVVNLRQQNIAFLSEQLRATDARFEVGELTRTDVEQARARLQLSRSQLALAKSDLAASIATYVSIVGRPPGALRFPADPRQIPKTLPAAIALSERINPQILAAAFNEEAARFNIKVVRGDLLPQLSLEASYTFRHDAAPGIDAETGQITGTLTIPIYQSGRVYSQLREARHVASQRRLEILVSLRQVREAVVTAWNLYLASQQVIVSARAQVAANRLALEGVRQEALVGTRTTLDVLDAEQELVDAQVTLISARRDRIVAGYQLLAAIGKLTAASLGLSVAVYDPADYYVRWHDEAVGATVKVVD